MQIIFCMTILCDGNDLVPYVHLLDLLAVRDSIELHIPLFHEILKHISDFSYRICIEIVDGLIKEQDRGVDV